jgi:hypothetical protein
VPAESDRLEESRARKVHWKRWGPYLAERAWGTVREDYSADGTAWEYFPHDHARSRAYRWNEDGLAGICDRHQRICLAVALWNERDAILKERPFGLSGNEGNHGEDVKEYYFTLDNTPTHSYMRWLYKYPQRAFPYDAVVGENGRRTRQDPEFELIDTGVFADEAYFDVVVEYAKATAEDLLLRIVVTNRGSRPASLRVLPTIWFRNTWSWGKPNITRPSIRVAEGSASTLQVDEILIGRRWFTCDGSPEWLFTENETDSARLFNWPGPSTFVKDAFDRYVVHGDTHAINPARTGTKAAAHYRLTLEPGATRTIAVRFSDTRAAAAPSRPVGDDFDDVFASRIREADEFYAGVIPPSLSPDAALVMRQSLAGLLWSKQYYHYVVDHWLAGDPTQPPPPPERLQGRNHDWKHLYNADVISMPDTWEYPWYASWDLGFHAVAMALVDPDFAKEQLVLLVREWYMHPSGQLPAYEWALDDVNPPVHAWAAWRVYKIEKKRRGTGDRVFLERVFLKLLLNFTWWVNRKDAEGKNVFQGGFLGLDNIGVFDRSKPLPTGGILEQSDGTSWMAMYTLNMLAIALELAKQNPAYEDVASKFLEHFLYIADAMNNLGDDGVSLWDEADGFYYDVLHMPDGANATLRVRSLVGLIPLFAIETLEPKVLESMHGFRGRFDWLIANRPDLTKQVASMHTKGAKERRLLSVVSPERLRSVMRYLLSESEFLSPHGVRALSRFHEAHPYVLNVNGTEYRVDYEPGESTSGTFGGNSNWRGPIWFPGNFLIIESLQKFHHYYGDDFKVECPTGSGRFLTLNEAANEVATRLTRIFLADENGWRPEFAHHPRMQTDPHFRDHVLFYEYFHGDSGRGVGASHQTGWTGLVAKLLMPRYAHTELKS